MAAVDLVIAQDFVGPIMCSCPVELGAQGAKQHEFVRVELGQVSLVGAGPGDPELLTVKALRRMQAAEVVLHDKLISDEVLSLCNPKAELVNVGKRCGDVKDRGLQQQDIHGLLLLHCREGKRVVRLKCGDPLIFGRGGEELLFLAEHGIRAEVVPGITAALGAAASCQMPLTHRGASNEVRFVVGQDKACRLPPLDWAELAKKAPKQTVVFYMGMRSLERICTHLLDNGAEESTPMALIESATFVREEMAVVGSISTLPGLAKSSGVGGGPVLLILGPTAAFPQRLHEITPRCPVAAMTVPYESKHVSHIADWVTLG